MQTIASDSFTQNSRLQQFIITQVLPVHVEKATATVCQYHTACVALLGRAQQQCLCVGSLIVCIQYTFLHYQLIGNSSSPA